MFASGFCPVSRARSARPSNEAHAAAAVTFIRVELCSTPYKVLRFAPTPLTRGLPDLDGVCAQLADLALT
jgi:hypothetical protein